MTLDQTFSVFDKIGAQYSATSNTQVSDFLKQGAFFIEGLKYSLVLFANIC
jgi:hypothetical protein